MDQNSTQGTFNTAGGAQPPKRPETIRYAARPASKVQILILQGHLSTPKQEMHLTPMGSAAGYIREEHDRRIRAEIEEHRKRLNLRQDVAKEAFDRNAHKHNDGHKRSV